MEDVPLKSETSDIKARRLLLRAVAELPEHYAQEGEPEILQAQFLKEISNTLKDIFHLLETQRRYKD